jgi:uncharacterized membrane-anchored protein
LKTLVIASGNAGKIREFASLLAGLNLEIQPQPEGLEVEETGETFAANARLKAIAVALATGQWALADDSGLGFAGGAALIGSLLAVTVGLARYTRVSKTLLFWVAFVLTRPFGATMGDVLTKPHARGGLGFGTIGSSAVLLTVLVALVAHAVVTLRRAPALAAPGPQHA